MGRRQAAASASFAGLYTPEDPADEPRHLLNVLFKSSTVGVAICDRQLRFRAINDALASMNGIPARAHLGRTVQAVLGSAAEKVVPSLQHVFATGQALTNVDVTAELPARDGVGHWTESYFPFKDKAGSVLRVGALVLELTRGNQLADSLGRLAEKVNQLTRELPAHLITTDNLCDICKTFRDTFERSAALLAECQLETSALQRLLHGAPATAAVRPLGPRQKQFAFDVDLAGAEPVNPNGDMFAPLSSREREVTALLALGQSNKEIAMKLRISIRTVETHRAKIMLKLDIHSLTDLVRYAVRTHLIRA
jgi:DNA-binding CsgD family transcriptional regulator